MDDFYAARSSIMPPLPWRTFAPPFSLHQVEYALNYCPRTVALRAGEVVYDGPSSALTPDFLAELYGAESEELFLPGLATSQANQKPCPAAKQNTYRLPSRNAAPGAAAAVPT